jgi:hypothetical protein
VGDSSGKLRRTRGVVIHYGFILRHCNYLYMLGDRLLWNRDTHIVERGRWGKVTA